MLFGNGGPEHRTLYYGDCLDWMKCWDSGTVDLIYLDPPFNSKANYNVLYKDRGAGKAQYRAFSDTWHWDNPAEARLAVYEGAGMRPASKAVLGLFQILGQSGMLAYLTYMAERLEEMKRLLKPAGSIFLHCDPTANSYLRVLMDSIFGAKNFRNEIIWCYAPSGRAPKYGFHRKHDVILYYGKSNTGVFNHQYTKMDKKTKSSYSKIDSRGRRYKVHGANRSYLDEQRGRPVPSWWTDIASFGTATNAKGRVGYPTEKPPALLERIISAASNPGEFVLDPFCGCGTAVDVARRLHRRWAGVDISSFAIDLIRKSRLADPGIATKGMPADLASARLLAREQPFNFESWAVTRIPGFAPNIRQVGDGGVDGRATLAFKPVDHRSRLALAQVKGGGFNLSQLRDFIHVTDRDKAALGVYVTLDPVTSPAATREAARARTVTVGADRYPRCQLWSISDHFEKRRPHLPTMTDPYTGKRLDQHNLELEP